MNLNLLGYKTAPATALKKESLDAMSRSTKDLNLSPLKPIDFKWNDSSRSVKYY
jgi:hypothetical protein